MDPNTLIKYTGIGGVALLAFYSLLKAIVNKGFIPLLSKTQGFRVVMRIISVATIIVLAALMAFVVLRFRESAKLQNIDLDDAPANHIQIAYYRFNGLALLDRATQGKGFTLEDGFSATPMWLKNKVFEEAMRVLSLYSDNSRNGITAKQEFDVMNWRAWAADGRPLEALDIRDRKIEKAVFDKSRKTRSYGADIYAPVFNRHPLFLRIDPADYFRRVENSSTWFIGLNPALPEQQASQGPIKYDQYYFFGLPESSEILNREFDPLSRQVLAENPELHDVVFLYGYQMHGQYNADVLLREIKFLVLDIENRGNRPIAIRRIQEKEIPPTSSYKLRTRKQTERAFELVQAKEEPVPLETIKPGEHLFIPLQLQLGVANTHSERLFNYERYVDPSKYPTRWWSNTGAQEFSFEVLRSVDEGGIPNGADIYQVPRSDLEQKPSVETLIERDYTIGTAIDVQDLVFQTADEGVARLKVRRFDPANLLVRGAYEKGSCPILFVKSAGGRLERFGPVLVDAVAKPAERTERIKLEPHIDAVAIAEVEDEISYLKAPYLEIKDLHGQKLTVPADDSPAGYIRLKAGTSKSFHFTIPEELHDRTESQLVITGYYVPNRLIKKR